MDLEFLYKMYSPKIFRVCLGYFNDIDKAKDVTQDTFISVFENLNTLKNEENISGWIYRIASNKCLRQIENEKRNHSITHYDFLNLEDKQESIDEEVFVKLHQSIAMLNELDRLIIGFYLENIPQEKIAEIIGLSHGNVRVRIHRIKETLTIRMNENE